MGKRIGVDIGGSFTDFAIFDDETRELRSLKTFSRPDAPGAEVLEGVRLMGERYGIRPEEVTYFTHGTTVGINTVIQRKGLKLALFVTDPFRDVLELARLKGPDMYNLMSRRPEPLIPRDRVFSITERIAADGSVVTPLSNDSLRDALDAALAQGVEGVVIAFMHSYRNSDHERTARELIEAWAPGLPVSCSSETWPIIREYERTITAVIGGYVQPRVAHYLGELQSALKRIGVTPEPHLTKSNGGIMTAEQGKEECVQMILSGTAAGVIGASYIARTSGVDKCMSLDIGGTSADVAIILDGEPQYGVGELIGDFHIHVPSVSVSSIGEGGGSVAWIDPLGVLRVGPESAGSLPGPACYGRGGVKPTITDAFVACGLVGLSDLGYSAVKVDREASRKAIAPLADRLGKTIEQVAEAIIDIAVSGMYSDVSGLVSRFGIDPREFSCLAFGGAGPMMACFLAREVGCTEVLVPPTPGVLSALGGLIADLKNDFLKTLYLDLEASALEPTAMAFTELKGLAKAWLAAQDFEGEARYVLSADMRYKGQSFEIETPLAAEAVSAHDLAALTEAFHATHERLYGHADREAAVQIISARMVVQGAKEKPQLPTFPIVPGLAVADGEAVAWLDGAERKISLYRRSGLEAGHYFSGPAVIMQDDTTTVVPAGFTVAVDEFKNLRISLGH